MNVQENGAEIVIDVLANDLFNTGATLRLVSINANSVTPSGRGTIRILDNGTPADLSDDKVGFTPTAERGPVTFTYVMTDSGNGSVPSTGTVTVQVGEFNDPPTAQNKAGSTEEDKPFTITKTTLEQGATRGGAGEEGQTLTVTDATLSTLGAGTVVVKSDESIEYTPAANFNGQALVVYTIRDNGTTGGVADPKSASATITITVTPVNDAPIPTNDSFSTPEDNARSVSVAVVLSNDKPGPDFADENSQTLSIGDVALVDTTQGTIAVVNNNIVFTPAANVNGNVLATYVVRDSFNPPAQATGTITFNVTSVNDAPVPVNVTRQGLVSVPLTIDLTEDLKNASRGAPNESGQTLQVTAARRITGDNATRGTVALNTDGTIRYEAPTNVTAEFTDVFEYDVTDNGSPAATGTARVSVLVKPFQPSQAGGRIWIDDNNNGVYDNNELFVSGLNVVLSGQPVGAATRSENLGTATTRADGSFSLDVASPGSYTVSFVRPSFLIDAPEAEQVNFTVDSRGGQTFATNFRVLGINSVANALWENQLSSYYTKNGQYLAQKGFTALIDANGNQIWNVHRGGFEAYGFNQVSINTGGSSLASMNLRNATATVVSRFIETERISQGADAGKFRDRIVTDTYTIPSGKFLMTRADGGNYLIRVLALPGELNATRTATDFGQAYGPATSTPPITAGGFSSSAVDSVLANGEWDD